jgi:hypothetical protein
MPERYAAKRLAAVEVEATDERHQHEFNAGLLRRALGIDADKASGPFTLLFFTDDSGMPLVDQCTFTLYDARARKHALRGPEFRLYYTSIMVAQYARSGDLFVAYRPPRGFRLIGIVARRGTRPERELLNVLQLDDTKALARFVEAHAAPATPTTAAALGIAERSGRPVPDIEAHPVVREASRARKVPPSLVLADAGRALAVERHGDRMSPDDFLHFAAEAETDLYMAAEEAVHGDRLKALAASASLAQIMAATLRIAQSRKSRRGQSLQNHFAALLERERIPFSAQCLTERKEKPDFVIPGEAEYHNPAFPASGLRMVACKSKVRDRWRQVLHEAARIDEKYLLTLDDRLTADSLDEMNAKGLMLFVPRKVRDEAYAKVAGKVHDVTDLIERLEAVVSASA